MGRSDPRPPLSEANGLPDPCAEGADEASRLARAFQAGDRAVLEALHDELLPLMEPSLSRYRDRPGALPTSLERIDLAQESWLILAELAERWDPAGGSFGAYFRVSFPWMLARYVRQHSPSRRAKGVRVLGAELPDVQEQLDVYSGADGREWDREVAWSELLAPLSEREQAVLLLHLAEQKPFTAVAQALRLTRPAAYRLYRRALRRVQGSSVRVGGRSILLDADSLNLEREGELLELVEALHGGAREDGRLPGRKKLIARTGLSEQRIARLLGLLVEAGCVRGRGPRRAGYLTHRSPAETLAVLGVRKVKV